MLFKIGRLFSHPVGTTVLCRYFLSRCLCACVSDASARMCEFEFSRGISEIFNGILGTVFMLIGGIYLCLVEVYGQHPSDE